jgi:hypothetical protein
MVVVIDVAAAAAYFVSFVALLFQPLRSCRFGITKHPPQITNIKRINIGGTQLIEGLLQDDVVSSRDGNGHSAESGEQIIHYIKTCQYDFFVDGVSDAVQDSSQQALTDCMSHRVGKALTRVRGPME